MRNTLIETFARATGGTRDAAYWAWGAAFVVAYVTLDALSYLHPFGVFGITAWDPQTGLGLALVILGGRKYVPWLCIAHFGADALVRGLPLSLLVSVPLSLAVGVIYGLAGTYLATRTRLGSMGIATRSDLLTVLAIMAAASLAVALLYVSVVTAAQLIAADQILRAIRRSWTGDMIGMTIVTPLILSLAARQPVMPGRTEAVVLLATMAGALFVVFGMFEAAQFQLFYLLLLPLIWIAAHAGVHQVTGPLLATQLLLIASIQMSHQSAQDLTAFQILMLVLALTSLVVGVLVTEQQTTHRDLLLHRVALGKAARAGSMGELAATLAHEINQPLTAIGGYLGVVRQLLTADPIDVAKVRDAALQAGGQVERAASVVRSLREFISSGTTRKSVVQPRDIVMRSLRSYEAEMAQKGIALEAVLDDRVPPIEADPLQIEQVIANLINNAADAVAGAGRGDGKVIVAVAVDRDGLVRFSVQDNGPGFDPAVLDGQLSPFTSTKSDGMGLGLALSRSIVEAHGGELVVASSLTGSNVGFAIPAAREEEK